MPGIKATSGKKYITIVQGKFRQNVPEGTEGSQIRHYETKDGKKGSKHELVFNGWNGLVTKIEFYDGEYGEVVNIHFEDIIVQVNKESRYFASLLEKLPNVNFGQIVVLTPYDFEDDEGARRVGVSVQQNGEKLQSHFFDGKKVINGAPDGKDVNWKDKVEVKIFFMQRDKFLINFIEENVIPKIGQVKPISDEEIPTIQIDEEEDESKLEIENVPF